MPSVLVVCLHPLQLVLLSPLQWEPSHIQNLRHPHRQQITWIGHAVVSQSASEFSDIAAVALERPAGVGQGDRQEDKKVA
jgi:hypothetical protein